VVKSENYHPNLLLFYNNLTFHI